MKTLKMKVTLVQPNRKGLNLPTVPSRHLSADDFMGSWRDREREREAQKKSEAAVV